MRIERLFIGGPLDNYNYLAICDETHTALVVDPLGVEDILSYVESQNIEITHIVNTHEHGDHVSGNKRLKEATGAKLFMPVAMRELAAAKYADAWLNDGDRIHLGQQVLEVIETPGHTMKHVSFFSRCEPGLLCGDTVFHAGVGNCYNGGDVSTLYSTIHQVISRLPDDTRFYPSHDNLINNLRFSLSREPSNQVAKDLLLLAETETPETRSGTTLGIEKQINPFFRLDNAELKETLKQDLPDIDVCKPEQVFCGLRTLRDNW